MACGPELHKLWSENVRVVRARQRKIKPLLMSPAKRQVRRPGLLYWPQKREPHRPLKEAAEREENMKKGLTEIVFILDRSGSMAGLESDTIGGFNALIEKQKKEEGEAYVSVVLFDDRSEVLYDRVDIRKVEPMNDQQYYVRGCTALLDAVGGAVRHIRNVHRYAREEDVPEKTLFVITTDGMENASRQYTYEEVKRLIEQQKKDAAWEFLFLGANIDAVSVAGRFGIAPNRAVRYENDACGTQLNFRVMEKAMHVARRSGSAEEMKCMMDEADVLEEVRRDYKARHRK